MNRGTIMRRYVHGPGADDPLLVYEGATVSSSARRSLQADHQGSIVSIAYNSGSAQTINAYDEYGVPKSGNAGRFQYTGQAWIPELGMYHYKARIYAPTLGRFMQTDPIGYDDQINLYAYVANDPVNQTDFTGLCGLCKWAIKAVVKGGRIADDIAGIADDASTLVSSSATAGERVAAAVSLVSEAVSPVSVRDGKTIVRGVERVVRGGESAATREGRRAHGVYGERARQEGLRTGRDARLPSGREPDAIDDANRTVRELKPDNPRAIARGERQVEGYRRELEETTGETWKGEVDTYRPRPR